MSLPETAQAFLTFPSLSHLRKDLLSARASPDLARREDGVTPSFMAVQNGKIEAGKTGRQRCWEDQDQLLEMAICYQYN